MTYQFPLYTYTHFEYTIRVTKHLQFSRTFVKSPAKGLGSPDTLKSFNI